MRIYVDVDGTLTTQQRPNSAFKCPLRHDVIEKVIRAANEGHEIILWSGDTGYARRVAEHLKIPVVAAVGKPELWIDNEVSRWHRRIGRRLITPEQFLLQPLDAPR